MIRLRTFIALLTWAVLASAARAEVPYDVEFTGAAAAGLLDALKDISRLRSLAEKPPASNIGLERRAQEDGERFREYLRSQGFYDPTVEIEIKNPGGKVVVGISIDPGPEYSLAAYDVIPPEPRIPLRELGLVLGRRAQASEIVAAQGKLLAEMANRGFPLARVRERRVVVDHNARTLSVAVDLDPGGRATFGPLTISGLRDLSEKSVRRAIYWPAGESWDPAKLEEIRRTLVRSELFTSVRIDRSDQLQPDGSLPVTLVLAERDKRSVGVGIGWSSDLGYEAEVFWTHRNLGGGGENLRVEGAYAQNRRIGRTLYRDPDLIARGVDYLAGLEFEEAETNAYDIRAARVSTGAAIRLGEGWTADAGIAYERLIEDIDIRTRRFDLVSLPLSTTYDTTDDLLDPSRGIRTTLSFTPFLAPLGSDLTFYRGFLGQSGYLKLLDDPRLVLAGWVQLGAILGAEAAEIPANKRFYAGGGGSVRAYGFQRAGPIDQAGDPVGGRGLVSFGIEPRVRVTDDIGLVTFFEAANVYNRAVPDQTRLRTGAGFGVRYFTPFGPVRADIAFPLDRRPNVDDAFQIYLSFGQAF